MKHDTSPRRYCGREFAPEQIGQIRALIRTHPEANRARLSYLVCEALNWRKPDGGLKDMSCRVAMLRMERDGLIELPAPLFRVSPCRSYSHRTPEAEPGPTLAGGVHELTGIRLAVVGKRDSRLWNEYIDRYHYLGYKPLPGAQLRYFAYAGEQVVGLFGFGAAAWKTAPRDSYIGWSREQRHANLRYVVNNARFLLLPWIRVRSLASKLLAMGARRLADDWEGRYGYRPVLLETFVDDTRFRGTCYQAANWVCVGKTTGRGKLGDHRGGQVPVKQVWVYPLTRGFREPLCR